MVEKITNSIANLENKTSKNSVRIEKSLVNLMIMLVISHHILKLIKKMLLMN